MVSLFSTYLMVAVLVSVITVQLWICRAANRRWRFMSFGDELKFHYFLLTLLLPFLFLKWFLPTQNLFQPIAKVWSTASIKNFAQSYAQHQEVVSFSAVVPSLNLNHVGGFSLLFFSVALVMGCLVLGRDIVRLRRILKKSYRFKKIARFEILFSESVAVPFSYWLPHSAGVVLPCSMIEDLPERKISLLHEIQHHRQRDPRWIYAHWFIQVLYFWNPAVYLWRRLVSEVQEFACDEAVVDRRKVSSQAYARCLFRVAQLARAQGLNLGCATGLSFSMHESLLKRRILEMFQKHPIKKSSRPKLFGLALCAVTTLSGVAMAAKGLVQDRRIGMTQAQALARNADSPEFPIHLNEFVLKQLNRYLGTAEGREYIRLSLEQMHRYQSVLDSKIQQQALPSELLAVPIVESRYRNLPPNSREGWGAGIWMVIENTALDLGLRVNAQVDDRLDVALETDAALRFLSAQYGQFQNWELALLAYNAGPVAVTKAMNRYHTNDAWDLVRAGFENDRDYLARVIAAVIILKNPQLLN